MADLVLETPAPSKGAAAPLTQSDAVASLLSLSFSEGGTASTTALASTVESKVEPGTQPMPTVSTSVSGPSSIPKHHRRLSSTHKTKRRLSDAREAANRPSPSLLQSNTAGLSLASLSLSSSPSGSYPAQLSTSFGTTSRKLAPTPLHGSNSATLNGRNIPDDTNTTFGNNGEEEANETGAIPIPTGRGRKRGIDYKCETCSKIYKHPSCLIKHRWEHTPHWREASKFVLSKHQQVQLLEAAAILSHMSPTVSGGRSLPDDRSLWPSYLSGGSLPTADSIPGDKTSPISTSVPSRPLSTGPRLHDYGVSPGVVTQVRPGLIGVTTNTGGVAVIGGSQNGSISQPVPVPRGRGDSDPYHQAWGVQSYGVSLPDSSVRSGSSPPRSFSRSRSGSAEGGGAHRLSDDSIASDDGVFDQMDGVEDDRAGRSIHIVAGKSFEGYSGRHLGYGYGRGRYDDFAVREEDEDENMDAMDAMGRLRKPVAVKREEQWDGMEMDMDMD